MARLIVAGSFALAGNAIAPGIGGQIGWLAGSLLGGALLGEEQKVKAPRLEDKTISSAAEGSIIPVLYGTRTLSGNIIFGPPLREVIKEEDVGGKGGPSTSVETVTYYATFAISFGQFNAQVRRVWANKKLIIDLSGDSDQYIMDGLRFTFYDGTQELPDPVIESFVGVGNSSAYKRHCYLMFNDMNVSERFGGQVPSIEAELTTNFSTASNNEFVDRVKHINETVDPAFFYRSQRDGLIWFVGSFGQNFSSNGYHIVVNPYEKSLLESDDFFGLTGAQFPKVSHNSYRFVSSPGLPRYTDDRIWYGVRQTGSPTYDAYSVVREWPTFKYVTAISVDAFTSYKLFSETSLTYLMSGARTTTRFFKVNKIGSEFVEIFPPVFVSTDALSNWDLNEYVIIGRLSSTNVFTAYDTFTQTSTPIAFFEGETTADPALQSMVYDPINNCHWGGVRDSRSDMWLIKYKDDGQVDEAYDIQAIVGPTTNWGSLSGYPQITFDWESNSLAFGNSRGLTFDVVTRELKIWNTPYNFGACSVYIGNLNTFISPSNSPSGIPRVFNIGFYRDEIIDTHDIFIAPVIEDICLRHDIGSSLVSTTGLSGTMRGYAITNDSTGRAAIEQLLLVAQGLSSMSDWILKFFDRGAAPVATIPFDDLGAAESQRSDQYELTEVYQQDVDIPKSLSLTYLSVEGDYQPATALVQYVTGYSVTNEKLDLPVAMVDQQAAELVDVVHQQLIESYVYSFNTTDKYTIVDPGDVVNVAMPAGTFRIRVEEVSRGLNGILQIKGISDEDRHNNSFLTAPGSGIVPETIDVHSPAYLIILDTNLLRDLDQDNPGPYITSFSASKGFGGVNLYNSPDSLTYSVFGSQVVEPIRGLIIETPVDIDWENWDTTNVLTVKVEPGVTLSSVTDEQIFDGANAFAWGAPGRWEVTQFKTATLVDTDTYELSDLLRGRRGTNQQINTHNDNDLFIFLDQTDGSIKRKPYNNSDIGSNRYFKAVNFGTYVADTVAEPWVVGTNPLKPYEPIDIAEVLTATLDFSWTRRTRRGGSYGGANNLTDGVGGPISEDSELYKVNLYETDGQTIANVYDTTIPSLSLTENDLLETYGILPPSVIWDVAQQSAVIGDGYRCDKRLINRITPIETVITGLSPTAFWLLDELNVGADLGNGTVTVIDSVGPRDGTYFNNPVGQQKTLTSIGTSVQFISTNSTFAQVPTTILNGATAWSMVMCVKPNVIPSNASQDQCFISVGEDLLFNLNFDVSAIYQVSMIGSDNVTYTLDSSATGISPVAGIPIMLGATFGGNILKFFINGSLIDQVNTGTNTRINNNDIRIGSYANGIRHTNGDLDCVSIWSTTTLTDQDMLDIAGPIYTQNNYDNSVLSTPGIQYYWPLNEAQGDTTIDDLAGLTTGTLFGSVTARQALGLYQVGMVFDGATAYIDSNENTQFTDFTVGTWFTPEFSSTMARQTLVSKLEYEPRIDRAMFHMYLNPEGTLLSVDFYTSGTVPTLTLSTAVVLGTLYYVEVSREATTAKIVLNGVEVDTGAVGALQSVTENWMIGYYSDRTAGVDTGYGKGLIGKVAIWDIARTASDANQLYVLNT